mmetsp:Transcript_68685/g.196976  ORF Transcript_68685/g.196976 Transcript_68685/m.196976 type:complete len:582 (+) Transcript_68685:261-2006(+)
MHASPSTLAGATAHLKGWPPNGPVLLQGCWDELHVPKSLVCCRRSGDGDHLEEVGVARALLALAVDGHHAVACLDHAVSLRLLQSLLNHRVRAHEGGCQHGDNAAHALQLADRALTGGDGQNGGPWAVLGDDPGSVAGLREGNDEGAAGVDRRLHGGGADGLHGCHALELLERGLAQALVQRLVLYDPLSLLADAAHDGHRLHREGARRRLAGEHDAVRAVKHGVRHVAGLGASGARQGGHGLQHLRGGDHGLANNVAPGDHHLLRQEHLLRRNLHAQVTARDHDAIARITDRSEVLQTLLVLDLRDDLGVLARLAKGLPDQRYVLGVLHEGGRDEVHALRDAEFDQVLDVLGLQNRQLHLDSREVAILTLAQLAIVHDLSDHMVGAHRLYLQRQGAINAQYDVAWLDGGAQHVVRDCEAGAVALEAVVSHELQVLALLEVDFVANAVPEEPSADLRALGVQHDGDMLAGPQLGGIADLGHGLAVHLVVAVGEVEAGDVHASVNQLQQHVGLPAGRAHGADNLALAIEVVRSVAELREGRGIIPHDNLALTNGLGSHGGECDVRTLGAGCGLALHSLNTAT